MTTPRDHDVITELLDMNVIEELRGKTAVSSTEMHSIFLRALHNTMSDVAPLSRPSEFAAPWAWRSLLSLSFLLFQAAGAVAVFRFMLLRRGL